MPSVRQFWRYLAARAEQLTGGLRLKPCHCVSRLLSLLRSLQPTARAEQLAAGQGMISFLAAAETENERLNDAVGPSGLTEGPVVMEEKWCCPS